MCLGFLWSKKKSIEKNIFSKNILAEKKYRAKNFENFENQNFEIFEILFFSENFVDFFRNFSKFQNFQNFDFRNFQNFSIDIFLKICFDRIFFDKNKIDEKKSTTYSDLKNPQDSKNHTYKIVRWGLVPQNKVYNPL